ncbi:hypothetical protein F5Y12DRAFT_715339 [Xylaria sp. FL1777]|nr:hypothetical protein F5Y12DRAFT_715339 [Xylaria sp. FL1777]
MVYVRPKKGIKPGPKKFPKGCRKRCDLRVPPAHHARPQSSFTRKRRTEVLLWLIDNRVATAQTTTVGEPYIASSVRQGQTPLTEDDHKALKEAFRENGVIYRPPTYQDASVIFNIGRANIASWWVKRKKYLSPNDYDRSNKLPMYETTPGAGNPTSARPHVLPETIVGTGTVDAADDLENDDGNDDSDDSGLPSPTVIEISDGSDMESDDDDDELPELEAALDKQLAAGARQAHRESSEGGQAFQDAPEYQNTEGQDSDGSDEDADGERVEEADMYGPG